MLWTSTLAFIIFKIYIYIYIYIYYNILFFYEVPDFKWYSSLYLLQLCFVWPTVATLIRQNQRVTINWRYIYIYILCFNIFLPLNIGRINFENASSLYGGVLVFELYIHRKHHWVNLRHVCFPFFAWSVQTFHHPLNVNKMLLPPPAC